MNIEIDEKLYEEEVESIINNIDGKYFKKAYYHELFMAGMDKKNVIRKLYQLQQGTGGCELARSVGWEEMNTTAVNIYKDELIPGYIVRIFNPLLNEETREIYATHTNLGSGEIRRATKIVTLGKTPGEYSVFGIEEYAKSIEVKLVKHQEGIWTQKK